MKHEKSFLSRRVWLRLGVVGLATLSIAAVLILHRVAVAPQIPPVVETVSINTPDPFASLPFHLEPPNGVPAPPRRPLLPEKSSAILDQLSAVKSSFPTYLDYSNAGMRIDIPVGPVRIDYGTPIRRSYKRPNLPRADGDFPGPGYRQQQEARPVLQPHSAAIQSKTSGING